MNILEVQNLCKTYGKGEAAVQALRDVTFSVHKGEFVAIVGESGSGKSTLLNVVGALDNPTAGKVLIDGKDIFSMPEKKLTVFRRQHIGFIFQSFNLIPELNVEQNITFPLTKSISRFARNTLDTLKYVRMLKDKGVAVFFEEENINTLTMDGELLLVILSSVAQQEVENISANVKKGLKMKMQRGELVGFQGCLGYDYNPEDKTLTVNEEEAAVVRYIFQRYTEGAGGSVIAKELENLGYKNQTRQSQMGGQYRNRHYQKRKIQRRHFVRKDIHR